MKLRRTFAATFAVTAVIAAAGISPVSAASTVNGGGSSFVANLVDICSAQYNRNTLPNPEKDTVSYSSVGSGTGKTNFAAGTYKFGATDSLYSSGAPANFVYVPLVAGPIGIGYRLDGVTPADAPVQLKAETVAKIFSGTVTVWNDPSIIADNKPTTVRAVKKTVKNGVTVTAAKSGKKVSLKVVATPAALKKFKNKYVTISRTSATGKVTDVLTTKISKQLTKSVAYSKGSTFATKVGNVSLGSVTVDNTIVGTTLTLPPTPIVVAYRSGTSGTSNNFTDYLNKTMPSIWTKPANDSFSSAFPGTLPTNGTFQAASGSDGVAEYVRTHNGAITYTELSYLEERAAGGVRSAAIQNNSLAYVLPSSAASAEFFAEAAVDEAGTVTKDYTVKSATAYMINAIAYGLAYKAVSTDNAAVKSYFSYFLTSCSPKNAAGAGYAPLGGSILTKALAQVAKINAG